MDIATAHARLGNAASAFLAGKHQFLIDGKWVDAKSGKKFDVFDPATGQAIAAVAEADAADVDEVMCCGNATTFGLGSGVWTGDVGKAHRLAKGLPAGSVWINCYQAMDPAVPFGSYKMSGYGRESGIQQMEEYSNVKAVWIKTA
jgi:acyl-CoA reductase-like NAD-dependent aldehyde dehydrogenase